LIDVWQLLNPEFDSSQLNFPQQTTKTEKPKAGTQLDVRSRKAQNVANLVLSFFSLNFQL